MKILIALLIMAGMISFMSAQTSFTIDNIHCPKNEFISDMQYANSRYYALSVNTEPQEPYKTTSTLMLFNDSGQLTYQVQLGKEGYQFFRIVSIHLDKLRLIGSIKNDSCTSILTLSEYDISEGTLTLLVQYPICNEQYIHSIRVVPGLDKKTFFEVVYSIEEIDLNEITHKAYIMTLDDTNNFSLVLDLKYWIRHLSVDFSGNGYILTDGFVCEYYDSSFNHRYQYNNGGGGSIFERNSSHQPLVNKYILEQVVNEDDDYHDFEVIRLVDSNLHVKKLAVISPLTGPPYGVFLPLHGGTSIASYNSVWTTANFGHSFYDESTYFSITRLDSDMKIICTHFIGFDDIYQIYGIEAFEDNGAIVYGWKTPYGAIHFSGDKDIYAIKVGNECELSTSTNSPQNPLHSISAYPNPGINDLTINVNGFDPATLRVEMINESGQVLFNAKDLTNSINVPELPAGQYFYRILQNERLLGVGAWVKH